MNDKIEATTVGKHMTRAPLTLGADQTLAMAHRLMRAKRIRHLPVLRGGKLVGMLSQRDLMLIETLPDVDPATVPVEDAMTTEVFAVSADVSLASVVRRMGQRRLGSAIVMEGNRVVGLFTATDACRTLARLLSQPARRSGRVNKVNRSAARP
jgi:acetoin utilization protein AcuB